MVKLEVDRPKSRLDDNIKMDIRQICLKDGFHPVDCPLFSITFWYRSCLIMASNESEGIWKKKIVDSWKVYLPYPHLPLSNTPQPDFCRISSVVLRENSE